jgi:hypothetical protein
LLKNNRETTKNNAIKMELRNAIPREAKMAIAEEMERTNESWRQT